MAPADGKCIPLSAVADPVFSSGAMGPGAALIWKGDVICSPCSGKVVMIASTSHAIGIQAPGQIELLLHIGMDTVELNGKGFTVYVKKGQKVRAGDRLISIDRTVIEENHIDLTTPVILTSKQDMMICHENEDVTTNDEFIRITQSV